MLGDEGAEAELEEELDWLLWLWLLWLELWLEL